MKIGIILATLLLGSTAFANGITVERVTQSSQIRYDNPYVLGGPRVTKTTFEFSVHTCRTPRASEYEINLGERVMGLGSGRVQTVEIKENGLMYDCMGPTRKHVLKLTTKRIRKNGTYVLLNPSVILPKKRPVFRPFELGKQTTIQKYDLQ